MLIAHRMEERRQRNTGEVDAERKRKRERDKEIEKERGGKKYGESNK